MQKIELKKQIQKYPDYQDSGVDWIGMVPKNWKVIQPKKFIKHHFSGIWGEDPKADVNDVMCLRVADFNYENFGFGEIETVRNVSKDDQRRKLLKKGNILLEKSGGGEKQPVGRAILFNSVEKMVCANFIEVIDVKEEVEPRYFIYFLSAAYSTRLNVRSIKQTTGIQNLDLYNYFSEYFVNPSREIQKKIADYLDAKTASIHKSIEQKQKLVELLKEKRAAVINRAVTRGLGEDATLVDSGVGWIGKVPKGWRVEKLKFVGQAIIGLTYSPEDVTDEAEGTLVLRSSNIQNNTIELNDNIYVKKSIPKNLKTKKGDILICSRNGSAALIGKSAVINGPGEGNTFGVFMSIFRSSYWRYMAYFFKSELFFFQLRSSATSTINQLTIDDLKNIISTIPKIEEQEKIAKFLDEKIAKIDECSEKIQKSIELLQEYKSSLIYNVVTGKVKV